ncbi:FkbM family methyltransferase [Flavobacterium sp.]|uniref:FkbM family methyltransferase n=1 Tax=Flavobacterium sp. TaxID=239 RepID=UPI00262D211A|nr:FkbM family methyltransferase [Flavobacterium sp.]
MLKILIQLAYQFWPELYKKRFFKSLNSLSTGNFKCEPELLYLNSVLKEDSTFIDIGTNKGIYLYQAEKIIQSGKIVGFEPNQEMVKFASHLFPKAQIFPLAVSSQTGTSVLNIPKKGTGLQDTRGSIEDLGDNVVRVEIKTITLDDWSSQQNIAKIDVVKIDVEGHEWDAIQGCKKMLEVIRPIFIVEIELRHAKYAIADIFEFIKGFGYDVFYFNRQTLQLASFDYTKMADFQKDEYLNDFNRYINNFIFIPKK